MTLVDALSASAGFLWKNPATLVRAARDLVGLRISIPIAGLRWLAEHAVPVRLFPVGLTVDAAPPCVRLGAEVDAMGTRLRASLSVGVDQVELRADAVRLAFRFAEIELELVSESTSPLAVLVRSGALDLSRPGDLIAALPARPSFLAESRGDRVIIDLLRVPGLEANPATRIVAALLSSLISIEAIEADETNLYIDFGRGGAPARGSGGTATS
jgi:hypothetical protein